MNESKISAAPPVGQDSVGVDKHLQREYSRELLFSTVVDLMTLLSLGLSPSLHGAARQTKRLPVSLAALYEKVNPTEPAILRALVQRQT
ncbi:IS4 transposase [Paraburkholderia sp. JPY162]|uniref:IS4 transposase n=1 Tax=Paraburkholderia youngii TaxID=2782701 RepID=A0A7W8LBM5_9BURK|nr:IS4 transposase [Paraburkholderia youngii]